MIASNIFHLLNSRSNELTHNDFCKWIKKENSQIECLKESFSYTPAMLYFILGFRDILNHLKYKNPINEMELAINQHCIEDEHHWMWYLQDLKTLGVNQQTWGNDWQDLIVNLWNDENRPTRDLVYLCIQLINQYNDVASRFVILECLESTFGVFMNTLKSKYQDSEVYKKLKFFGKNHQDHEMNHTLGSWIEDEDADTDLNESEILLNSLSLTDDDQKRLSQIINVLFDQFELVFKTWLNQKDIYLSKMNYQLDNNKLVSLEIN